MEVVTMSAGGQTGSGCLGSFPTWIQVIAQFASARSPGCSFIRGRSVPLPGPGPSGPTTPQQTRSLECRESVRKSSVEDKGQRMACYFPLGF